MPQDMTSRNTCTSSDLVWLCTYLADYRRSKSDLNPNQSEGCLMRYSMLLSPCPLKAADEQKQTQYNTNSTGLIFCK